MKLIENILTLGALAAATTLFLIATTSCNTTRGFGEDVEQLGEEIGQEAAQHTHY